MADSTGYQAQPIWTKLGEGFSDVVKAATFPKTTLRYRNQRWSQRLGFRDWSDDQWVEHFGLFKPLPNNLEKLHALRYHGHQFLHYNPDLGDGRGFLYGQVKDKVTQRILDFGTKGSGQTPYSRRGDGRLTLKGAVREILATTYLEAMGVNTSKTFSVIETGEQLQRNDEPSPTRSAVLVRLSHSHIRIGTFQRLAFYKEKEHMGKLVDYCREHFYPDGDFFNNVCREVAATTAQWMINGFVHGVLNTDNINITGESFDYGPYRFLPHYDPHFTAAYFDREGLYAYGRQPQILMWNLQQLEKSLHLINEDKSSYEKGYDTYQSVFEETTFQLFLKKLNLKFDGDWEKVQNLFETCIVHMEKSKYPFEQFFFDWQGGQNRKGLKLPTIEKMMSQYQVADEELLKHPYYQKDHPETLIIDEIEDLWKAIDQDDNWQPLYNKLTTLEKLPYHP